VAYEVATSLGAELDVLLVRKLGVPGQPELGFGAIGEGGVRVLTEDVMQAAMVTDAEVEQVTAAEREELRRRAERYRGGRELAPLRDRCVVVVDDGIATGGSASAALEVARAHRPAHLVLATPVAPPETAHRLARRADEVIVVEMPVAMRAIGLHYRDFSQTSDDEVVELLAKAARSGRAGGP
jgi:predicted phosphoribosyltransferase